MQNIVRVNEENRQPVKEEKIKAPSLRELNNKKKIAFLKALVQTGGNISRSAQAAEIDRSYHYRWLRDDPLYKQLFETAYEESISVLEDEALRRAVEGYSEPIMYQGRQVGTRMLFSDNLLMFMLKEKRPSYRDNANAGSFGVFSKDGNVNIQFNIPRPETVKLNK